MPETNLAQAVIIALAGGGGVVLSKLLDYFMSRSSQVSVQLQHSYTRQREIDNVKDSLISTFQEQINDLRIQIDKLIEKNMVLYEENIKLKYTNSECMFQITRFKEKWGITNY